MNLNIMDWNKSIDYIVLGLIPFGFYFIKSLLPKIIDERLQIQIEQVKHQNQRSQFRYKLFTEKQHDVLLNIHQLYGEAKGQILCITDIYTVPDFTNYTITEFEEWLSRQTFKMLESDKTPIRIALQVKNYRKANELIHNFIITCDYQLACNRLIEAHNCFLKNKIYVPVKLIKEISELHKCLNDYCISYCKPERLLGYEYTDIELQRQFDLRDKINILYEKMTDDFRTYLENGDN